MRVTVVRRLTATLVPVAIALSVALGAGTAVGQDKPRLERGSAGPDVSRVQAILVKLRYTGVKSDGKYGPVTEAAIKRFQQGEGISPVDGIVGATTWAKLEARSAGGAASLGACAPPPTIARGASGKCVEEIQRKLNEQVRQSLTVDGKFGGAVEKAVKLLQRANGLKEDGKVGPATWEKLRA